MTVSFIAESEDEMYRIWYAIQEDPTDDWGYGTYDYYDAVDMLKEQGHGQIAVIEETDGGTCCIAEWGIDEAEHEMHPRVCDECGDAHWDGYYIEDGEYYCSDECLHKHYTQEEYMEMYEADEAYWTEWFC